MAKFTVLFTVTKEIEIDTEEYRTTINGEPSLDHSDKEMTEDEILKYLETYEVFETYSEYFFEEGWELCVEKLSPSQVSDKI